MDIRFDSLFTPPQLKFLADTVQIGTDAYALLTQNADSPFSHLYMRPEGTRIRTKLMQMQVALGAASPQCPFAFRNGTSQAGKSSRSWRITTCCFTSLSAEIDMSFRRGRNIRLTFPSEIRLSGVSCKCLVTAPRCWTHRSYSHS